MPSTDGRDRVDVVTGTISVDFIDAYSGASFSFVLEGFVVCTGISVQQISQTVTVSSAKGPISSTFVCLGCHITLADEDFVANLVIIPLDMFDVILGMDWLSQYQAIISYFWKTISLQAPSGREVVFQGNAPKFSNALLCYMFPSHWLRRSGLLWTMMEVRDATLSIKDIPVVCRYPDVFLADLRGLPPER